MKEANKNIILFVGNVHDAYVRDIIEINKKRKHNFRIALLYNIDTKINLSLENQKTFYYFEMCDLGNKKEIKERLKSIKDEIISVHIVYEKYMEFYIDVLKILGIKYYSSPNSLRSSVDKLKMRKAFYKYDPCITPRFIQVKSQKAIPLIIKKIGFPCILKPAHLFKSKLVSISYNEKSLKGNMQNIFNLIQKTYDRLRVDTKPIILAEEMMEGKVYSIDVYVDRNRMMYFTPLILQITARDLGIDDLYIYNRINPSGLTQNEVKEANRAAEKSINALHLINTVAHIELMKTKSGWKIIEIGPRIGGYRLEMLKSAYNINHFENCILTRLNKKPVIHKKIISYTALLEFFPKREGCIKSIKGINNVKKLNSFYSMKINSSINNYAGFAKNGYLDVLYVMLANKNKKIFSKDLKAISRIIKIEVK